MFKSITFFKQTAANYFDGYFKVLPVNIKQGFRTSAAGNYPYFTITLMQYQFINNFRTDLSGFERQSEPLLLFVIQFDELLWGQGSRWLA